MFSSLSDVNCGQNQMVGDIDASIFNTDRHVGWLVRTRQELRIQEGEGGR